MARGSVDFIGVEIDETATAAESGLLPTPTSVRQCALEVGPVSRVTVS